MEKEIKISELSTIWGVSVPSVWNRIRREGLTTVKKLDENRKEITFVNISDELLEKYSSPVNNNGYKPNNNRYYEDMLNDKDVNNDVVDVEYVVTKPNPAQEFLNEINNVYKQHNEELKTVYAQHSEALINVNNDYINRLEQLNNELSTYKGQQYLLTERENREGLHIAEINQLKEEKSKLLTDADSLKTLINRLQMVIISLICVIVCFGMFVFMSHKTTHTQTVDAQPIITDEIER